MGITLARIPDRHLLYCSVRTPAKETLISRETFRHDIDANLQKLERLGVRQQAIPYFVPPYEHYNSEVAGWCAELQLTLVNPTPGLLAPADYTAEADAKLCFVATHSRQHRRETAAAIRMKLERHDSADASEGARRRGGKTSSIFGWDRCWTSCPRKAIVLFASTNCLQSKWPVVLAIVLTCHSACWGDGDAIFLRANQVGYRPGDSKSAVVFGNGDFDGTARILDTDSGKEVWRGPATILAGSSWAKFSRTAEIDFSAFRQPGHFRLVVGQSRSLPFRIGDDLYRPLPDLLLEFMRQQRCGYNPFLDATCHQHDGRTAYGPNAAGTQIDVRGGWHDAADQLKYLLTSSNATAADRFVSLATSQRSCRR